MDNKSSIGDMISKSGVHRLIVCSELRISLAMLDDFIEQRVKMPEELYTKLLELIKRESETEKDG